MCAVFNNFLYSLGFRYEKSTKEVKTLHFVQRELSKIDNLVTHDVDVLRERIEEADRLYNSTK